MKYEVDCLGNRVTPNVFFHPSQILLVTFCDLPSGMGASLWKGGGGGQGDMKVEIVIDAHFCQII